MFEPLEDRRMMSVTDLGSLPELYEGSAALCTSLPASKDIAVDPASGDVADVEAMQQAFEEEMKEGESDERHGSSQIQELMSDYNPAEQLYTRLAMEKEDAAAATLDNWD